MRGITNKRPILLLKPDGPGLSRLRPIWRGAGRISSWGATLICGLGMNSADASPEQRAALTQKIKGEVAADKKIVIDAGGLYIVGEPERHELRRIDNQLRGRSGRQGDPGASMFFLAQDDLMRIFSPEALRQFVLSNKSLGLKLKL